MNHKLFLIVFAVLLDSCGRLQKNFSMKKNSQQFELRAPIEDPKIKKLYPEDEEKDNDFKKTIIDEWHKLFQQLSSEDGQISENAGACKLLNDAVRQFNFLYLEGVSFHSGDCELNERELNWVLSYERKQKRKDLKIKISLEKQNSQPGLFQFIVQTEFFKIDNSEDEKESLINWNPKEENFILHSNLSHLAITIESYFNDRYYDREEQYCYSIGRKYLLEQKDCDFSDPTSSKWEKLANKFNLFSKLQSQEERVRDIKRFIEVFRDEFLQEQYSDHKIDVNVQAMSDVEVDVNEITKYKSPLWNVHFSYRFMFYLNEKRFFEVLLEIEGLSDHKALQGTLKGLRFNLYFFKENQDASRIIEQIKNSEGIKKAYLSSQEQNKDREKFKWDDQKLNHQDIVHPNMVYLPKVIVQWLSKDEPVIEGIPVISYLEYQGPQIKVKWPEETEKQEEMVQMFLFKSPMYSQIKDFFISNRKMDETINYYLQVGAEKKSLDDLKKDNFNHKEFFNFKLEHTVFGNFCTDGKDYCPFDFSGSLFENGAIVDHNNFVDTRFTGSKFSNVDMQKTVFDYSKNKDNKNVFKDTIWENVNLEGVAIQGSKSDFVVWDSEVITYSMQDSYFEYVEFGKYFNVKPALGVYKDFRKATFSHCKFSMRSDFWQRADLREARFIGDVGSLLFNESIIAFADFAEGSGFSTEEDFNRIFSGAHGLAAVNWPKDLRKNIDEWIKKMKTT